MNPDLIFALYVFCSQYHSGQWSRGYRLLSRIESRYRPRLSDSGWNAIAGNRHSRTRNTGAWEEWEESRQHYRNLKRKYAEKM